MPEEVTWYLRELVGCKTPSPDGRNYSFRGADAAKRKIYVPVGPPTAVAQPTKKKYERVLQDLWLEATSSADPRRRRYECMLATLDQGGDDRVIFWNHIAPDEQTPVPAHLVWRRDVTTIASAVDPKCLFENIKTMADVHRQPAGNGLGFGKIVTGLRKTIEELQPDLFMFRGMHDQIIETHRTLENRANAEDGGSSSMPKEYRSVKDWVSRQTNNKQSVLNCVISSGTP